MSSTTTTNNNTNGNSGGCCTIQVKTLKGQTKVLNGVNIHSTVRDLYKLIDPLEDTTPNSKWKLMIVKPIVRTLRPSSDMEKVLSTDYGFQSNNNDNDKDDVDSTAAAAPPIILYKIEVILDMGACHTSCKR